MRKAQAVLAVTPESCTSLEDCVTPGCLSTIGSALARQPGCNTGLVVGCTLPKRTPSVPFDQSLDVMISRNKKKTCTRNMCVSTKLVEELSRSPILFAKPPIRKIPGKTQTVDGTSFDKLLKVANPCITKNPPPLPPVFGFPRATLVKVRYMKQAHNGHAARVSKPGVHGYRGEESVSRNEVFSRRRSN